MKLTTKHVNQENILLLIYISYSLFMISCHAGWRDEGQAWLIARDRSSLFNIITTMGYEATPALWHICLYLLNHILHLPVLSMFLFHSGLNITATYIFVKKTQFHFFTKILFCFSYLIAFEYNIIARSYVLTLILLFIWALIFGQRLAHRKQYAIVLALLSQTNSYGFLISAVLSGNYLLELFLPTIKSLRQQTLLKYAQSIAVPVLIISAGLLCAYLQMLKPADFAYSLPSISGSGMENLIRVLFRGLTTITPDLVYTVNAQTLFYLLYNNGWEIYLGLIITLISVAIIFKQVRIGLLYTEIILLMAASFLYLFSIYGFVGFIRHWGIFFIVFISCSMALNSELLKFKKSNIGLEFFIIFLLIFHVCHSFTVIPEETNRNFSSGKATASYLLKNNIVKANNIAIFPTWGAAPILPYLPRNIRFYFPETDQWGSYTLWNTQWLKNRYMGYQGLIDVIEANPDLNNQIEYIITNEEITSPWYTNKVALIKNWEGSTQPDENFYIYRRVK